MRNAVSIARGASSETSEPSIELMSRLKLISPSPIVTGSISMRTGSTRGSRQVESEILSVEADARSVGIAIASCTTVPASTPIAYA